MLRVIQVCGSFEIVKSSNNRTGITNFYGVRGKGKKNTPFDDTFDTLYAARSYLDVGYHPPLRETKSKADYAAEYAKKVRRK